MIDHWHGRTEGERRENKPHGKRTLHHADGIMENHVFENGIYRSEKEITDKDEAFYLGGVPHKAFAPNWSDFV